MSDPTVFPYSPRTPPEGEGVPRRLALWAYREFQDLSDEMGVRPEAVAVMAGVASSMTLGTTRAIITGYPTTYEGEGFRASVNAAAGTITLPATGLYYITGHAALTHSTATQNDAAMMFLRHPGGDSDFAGWPVATNKIQVATFNGQLAYAGLEGAVLSLGLYASTSLGTATFIDTEFRVQLSTLA